MLLFGFRGLLHKPYEKEVLLQKVAAPIPGRQWLDCPVRCGHFVSLTNCAGALNTCRVIALLCMVPYALYANVAALPLAKVSVIDPTDVTPKAAGRNGTAFNAGPGVRYSVPVYVPAPVKSIRNVQIAGWIDGDAKGVIKHCIGRRDVIAGIGIASNPSRCRPLW